MKKFLCYDTNDAANGKINVDNRVMLKPNSTVPSTNGTPYQQLVTDGAGNTKWEDRLAYEDSRLAIDVGEGNQLVKVADKVPSWATVNAPIKVWMSNGMNQTANPEDYIDYGNGSFSAGMAVFITTDNFVVTSGETSMVFPEKGVYFVKLPRGYITGIASADSDTPEIAWDGNIGEVKKLDEKFLPGIPVIEVEGAFEDTIEDSSQPIYPVQSLSYSEILAIFNGKNFVIKDTDKYYTPQNIEILTNGGLFVQILVNRMYTSGNIVLAELFCSNRGNRFFRNAYWTIAGTKHEDK